MKNLFSSVILISIAVPLITCVFVCLIVPPQKNASKPPEIIMAESSNNEFQAVSSSNNQPSGIKLIDVSDYVSVSNWNAVDGAVQGVYIKATEGASFIDSKFNDNASGALKANIKVGFYHYFWPESDVKSSVEQADFFYNTIKNYKFSLYPVIDVEVTNNQSGDIVCNDIKAFEQEFQRVSGITAMIYCSSNFANKYLTDKGLSQFPLWIACYNVSSPTIPTAWQNYSAWQYNDSQTIPGISSPVDADVATANVFINTSDSIIHTK